MLKDRKLSIRDDKKLDNHTNSNVVSIVCFRSLVSIQGPEGYGPSTLPLRHSEAMLDGTQLF